MLPAEKISLRRFFGFRSGNQFCLFGSQRKSPFAGDFFRRLFVTCCVFTRYFFGATSTSHQSRASPKQDYTQGSSRPTCAATPGVDSSDGEEVSCGGLAWEDTGFFVALFCLEKLCSGLFRSFFVVFFVAFSWLFRGFFVLGKFYAYSPWNSLLIFDRKRKGGT